MPCLRASHRAPTRGPRSGQGGAGRDEPEPGSGAVDATVASFFEPAARAQLLAAADARRRAGQLPAAAEILALALRDEDASAVEILAVAEAGLRDADRAGAASWARLGLVLVRADALHVLGRHDEAAMAYAAARRLALADLVPVGGSMPLPGPDRCIGAGLEPAIDPLFACPIPSDRRIP